MFIEYFINSQPVHPPINEEELTIEINFDMDATRDGEPVKAVSLNSFQWGLGDVIDPMDGARIIIDWKERGLTTGVGVFEGIPFTIRVSEDSQVFVFEKYINAAKALYDGCKQVTTETVDRHKIDWLNNVADSVSYESMFLAGEFLRADFIPMPYIDSDLPDNKEVFTSIISLFVAVGTLADQIQQTVEYAAGIVALSAADVIKLILRLIYIALLFLTIVSLIKHFLNSLIQPIKYINGMTWRRQMQIGAAHFGFQFESPILDNAPWNKAVIFPKKSAQKITKKTFTMFGGILQMIAAPVEASTYGFITPNDPTSKGFFGGTPGELFRAAQDTFKAKVLIEGNKLKLVPRDFSTSAPNYIIPDVDDDDFTLNSEELIANYVIQFATDINEKNTIQNSKGNITQAITKPIAISNPDLVLIEKKEIVQIPFARGSRKENLTAPEAVIEQILGLVSILSGLPASAIAQIILPPGFGKPSDRIGMLLMENDFLEVPKLCIVDENINEPSKTKLNTNNKNIVHSENIYLTFHKPIVSFVPTLTKPNANQYIRKNIEKIPQFCFKDFVLLENNNKTQDNKGRDALIISGKWNLRKQELELDYKINQLYTKNVREEIITPDGK